MAKTTTAARRPSRYEYDHEYGVSLTGKAKPKRSAARRPKKTAKKR